jgi:D-galactarolactone cycloisomerase
MHRRDFLRKTLAGGAGLLAGAQLTKGFAMDAPMPAAFDAAAAQRTLGEHRIAKMIARHVQDRWPRTVGPNSGGDIAGTGGGYQVRQLLTDKGAAGWGMSYWKDEVGEKFIGARVGDLFDVTKGTADEAFPLDILLHDLAGHILGVPAYVLMGSKGPRQVPIYSGAIYFDDLLPTDKPRGVPGVLASCQQDFDAGYRAFKLKIGRGRKWIQPRAAGLKRDIEVIRAVREKFPDCRVLVDANDAYTVAEAVELVKAVADCDLYWIEEPFEENRDDLLQLKDAMAKAGCRALIADGESRRQKAETPTEYGGYVPEFTDRLYKLGAERLVDVILWDLGIVGYTRWRRIMPKLAAAGLKASPHTWMWTPRPYYAAQLAAGAGNVCLVEGIPGKAAGIDYSAYTFATNGDLVMPAQTAGMGLGWELK